MHNLWKHEHDWNNLPIPRINRAITANVVLNVVIVLLQKEEMQLWTSVDVKMLRSWRELHTFGSSRQ